jgi:hypothetical protein
MTHRREDTYRRYRRLRGTVRMLGSDATVQVAYLDRSTEHAKYPILADDITTEFECFFGYAEQLADNDLLSPESLDALAALRHRIGGVEAGSEHWSAEARATSPVWAAIREQARTALAAMDEHYPAGALSKNS